MKTENKQNKMIYPAIDKDTEIDKNERSLPEEEIFADLSVKVDNIIEKVMQLDVDIKKIKDQLDKLKQKYKNATVSKDIEKRVVEIERFCSEIEEKILVDKEKDYE